MALFQKSILAKYLNPIKGTLREMYKTYSSYFLNEEIQENILQSKEEQFQEGFLRELFVKLFGYTINPEPNFNLTTEFKNSTDSRKADGAILLEGNPIGIIELKDHKTQDLREVETQAFSYKSKHKGVRYVVISNFEKLRFYIDDAVDCEEFDLFNLTETDFEKLYLLLSYENIKKNIPLEIKSNSCSEEKNITDALYKDYSTFKRELFADICKRNAEKADKLTLFRKTQKLLDRLLFIFFAEDRGLIPPNIITKVVGDVKKLRELDVDVSLYDRFKKYFGYLDKGYKGKDFEIFAYNGGLFRTDNLLDSLEIDDSLLEKHSLLLSAYDFESDVSVDILGHIFEHSLSEIEEIEQSVLIPDKQEPAKKSKRKTDGVFYTPAYITRYIVENTLGSLCKQKKDELDISENKSGKSLSKKKQIEVLDEYRKWLLSLKICDPACGSGAFLNAALEFLIEEHHFIDEQKALLHEKNSKIQMALSDIDVEVLENNIYGVDINEESVEIAKLSLWLHTARPGRKLTDLSKNIKCGNSLIDDPSVAGEKAFNWKKEFPEVFEKEGFDIIVGNPPYVDIKQMDKLQVNWLFNNYSTTENRINLYSTFIELGYRLIKQKGFLSFINPNSMLVNSSYTKLRKMLINDLQDLVKLPDDVFADAKVETIIFVVRKNSNTDNLTVTIYTHDSIIHNIDKSCAKTVNKQNWLSQQDCNYNIYATNEITNILCKIRGTHRKLSDIADFSLGITPYDKYKGHSADIIKNRKFHSNIKKDDSYKPLITGENVTRYFVSDDIKEYIKYGDWLGAPREERFFTEPRIIVRQIISGNPPRIYAGYTEKALYFTQIGFGVIPHKDYNPKYILALLNSKLMVFYHKYKYLDLEKDLFQKILIANCKEFPIPDITNNHLSEYVDMMIKLQSQLQQKRFKFIYRLTENFNGVKINATLEKFDRVDFKTVAAELKKQKNKLTLVQQDEWEDYFNSCKKDCKDIAAQIAELEHKIDNEVYALYGLSSEEIAIIEKSI